MGWINLAEDRDRWRAVVNTGFIQSLELAGAGAGGYEICVGT
jgi:hypothetical protein